MLFNAPRILERKRKERRKKIGKKSSSTKKKKIDKNGWWVKEKLIKNFGSYKNIIHLAKI